MTKMLLRVILLLGVMFFTLEWLVGYSVTTSAQASYDLSTEQISALYIGIKELGWLKFTFIVLGFLYRRTIMLMVKNVALFLIAFLPKTWRRSFARWLAFPKEKTRSTWGRLNGWYDTAFGVAIANWLRAVKYSTLLALVFVGLFETVLALVYGLVQLPPIVLQYKAVIISTIASFFLASLAQWFLLLLAGLIRLLTPLFIRRWVSLKKFWLLRWLVWFRYTFITRRHGFARKKRKVN